MTTNSQCVCVCVEEHNPPNKTGRTANVMRSARICSPYGLPLPRRRLRPHVDAEVDRLSHELHARSVVARVEGGPVPAFVVAAHDAATLGDLNCQSGCPQLSPEQTHHDAQVPVEVAQRQVEVAQRVRLLMIVIAPK